MKIYVLKEKYNSILVIKNIPLDVTEEDLIKKYNFVVKNIDDVYNDCDGNDFDEDLTFNVDKYNARKMLENNQSRIVELKQKLSQLSEDFIQSIAGEIIDDLDSRKAEFVKLHNELRVLLGKSERKVEKSNIIYIGV